MSVHHVVADGVSCQAPSYVCPNPCHENGDTKLDDGCGPVKSPKTDELHDKANNGGGGASGCQYTGRIFRAACSLLEWQFYLPVVLLLRLVQARYSNLQVVVAVVYSKRPKVLVADSA